MVDQRQEANSPLAGVVAATRVGAEVHCKVMQEILGYLRSNR